MSFEYTIENSKCKKNAKKTILNYLNNIINKNKEHYESLKFKLVTDLRSKKKTTEIAPHILPEKGTNSFIVKLNENDYDLKLPCGIIQTAFNQVETDNTRKFRNQRENYIFIRKLIKECKFHFISCVDTIQKSHKNATDSNVFISNLILEVISGIIDHSNTIKQTQHTSISIKQCDIFAESLINELFTDLKLDVSKNNQQVISYNRPRSFTESGNEEHDTLDDMSSINSSIDSHCRQIFVHKFFLKRRHSYDVANNLANHSDFFDCVLKEESNLKSSKYKVGYSNGNMGYAKAHVAYSNLTKRRHSINSFSLNSNKKNLLNEELIELENLRLFSKKNMIELQPKYSTVQKDIHSKRISKLSMLTRTKFKHYNKIIASKHFKKLLMKLSLKDTFSAHNMLSTIADYSRQRHPKKCYHRTVLFAGNLIDFIWQESIQVVKQVYDNIETNFVDTLVEDIFTDAYKEIITITQTIKRNDRFFFRCECLPNSHKNSESNNINCLLTVYCMMIALAECNLTNQITFVCCHFA